ncbi:hypothetical protein [Variovorax sp. DAIF25]|uniref:hypothetical protein n=1 Tax=Variovorax sp. DAIF25 TaxID=3080983 RepID=UPI003D6C08C5
MSARSRARWLACIAACILLPAAAQEAASADCREGRNAVLSGLSRSHVREEFRIFYALEGPHALPDTRDLDGNGVPDKVEDVATQLVVGRRLFTEVMGLTHPLRQPRYARAASIDVFLLKMEKGNGLSYDEPMNYRLDGDGPAGRCATRIDLLNSHSNQNVTPIHELFHQYQYAYTMFKPRWFLEGTARWAEHALRAGEAPQRQLPATPQALREQVFSQTYATSGMWNRIAAILDPAGRIDLPPDLARATYVDGSPVVHDGRLHGAAFVKALLEALGPLDHRIAARNGWRVFGWREDDQRSSVNDGEIFRQVLQVVRDQARVSGVPRSGELEDFLALQAALP